MSYVAVFLDRPSSAQYVAEVLSGDPEQVVKRGQGDTAKYEAYGFSSRHGANVTFVVSSATGTLQTGEFTSQPDPEADEQLYDIPLVKKPGKQRVIEHIQKTVTDCDEIICMFDNDRKGECKTFDLIEIVKDVVGAGVPINRARLQAYTEFYVKQAIAQASAPSVSMRDAWEMVQEINPRVGQSFMAFLNRVFLQRYTNLDANGVCYGMGITPTLALCVTRGIQGSGSASPAQGFPGKTIGFNDTESKTRWTLQGVPENATEESLQPILQELKSAKRGRITSVQTTLLEQSEAEGINIVMLMQLGSRELGFGPSHTVQLAEGLFYDGYITYPRTLATQYPEGFDFSHYPVQPSAALRAATKCTARVDQQIPITPVVSTCTVGGDKEKLFHAIIQQYTASCTIRVTTVVAQVGKYSFATKGMRVIGTIPLGNKRVLPDHPPIDKIPASGDIEFNKCFVCSPAKGGASLYTEADLIADMGSLGIGADGSMGPYINTIIERKFVVKDPKTRSLKPTNLGDALFRGFYDIDPGLVDTKMRARIELAAADVEKGLATKERASQYFIQFFKERFAKVKANVIRLVGALDATFDPNVCLALSKSAPQTRSLLYTAKNVGPYIGQLCTETLAETKTVSVYDTRAGALYVFGPKEMKESVSKVWATLVEEQTKKHQTDPSHLVMYGGQVEAKFHSGLTFESVRATSPDLVVKVRVLINSKEMLDSFLREKNLVNDKADILAWYHYDRPKMIMTLSFKAKASVYGFINRIVDDPQVQYLGEVVGRRIQFFSEMTQEELDGEFHEAGYAPLNTRRGFYQPTTLKGMPAGAQPRGMKLLCDDLGIESYEYKMVRSETDSQIVFTSLAKGGYRLLQTACRDRSLPQGVSLSQEKGKGRFVLDFFTNAEAEGAIHFLKRDSRVQDVALTCDVQLLTGSEEKDVFSEAFLTDLSSRVKAVFGTGVQLLYGTRGKSLRLLGGDLVAAYNMIHKEIDSIKLDLDDAVKIELVRRWKLGEGRVHEVAAEANVNIVFNEKDIQIFGTPQARGTVIVAIAGEFERLGALVTNIPIPPSAHMKFLPGTRDLADLIAIGAPTSTRIGINYAEKTVQIIGNNQDDSGNVVEAVNKYLTTHGVVPYDPKCGCGKPSAKKFSSCGHDCCEDCFQAIVTGKVFPLKCTHPDHNGDTSLAANIHVDDLEEVLPEEDFESLARDAIAKQHDGSGVIGYCLLRKQNNCMGMVLTTGGYTTCSACKTPMCARCHTTDATHEKISCSEYQKIVAARKEQARKEAEAKERLERRNRAQEFDAGGVDVLMNKIYTDAAKHYRTWPKVYTERRKIKDKHVHGKDEYVSYEVNKEFQPHTYNVNKCWQHLPPDDCPVRQRFHAACRAVILRGGDPGKGVFAWHGTPSKEALESICHEGFDTKRRWGQLYGKGEYFGLTPDVSHGYAGGSGQMMLCYIIQGSHVKEIPGFCYVVNNPSFEMYSIPVLVVTYNKDYTYLEYSQKSYRRGRDVELAIPPHFHPKLPLHAPRILPSAHFEWALDKRRSAWHRYTDNQSRYLEERLDSWKNAGDQDAKLITMYICREMDHLTAEYTLNLETLVQTNVKSKYTRAIRRVNDVPTLREGEGAWHIFNDTDETWKPVHEPINAELDKLYRDYCLGRGRPIVPVAIVQGDHSKYLVNFLEGNATKAGLERSLTICRGIKLKPKK